MKTIISLIVIGLSVLMSQAQVKVYDETKASQFEKNLVSTAIKLADTFGPDWEVKNAIKIEISGPIVFQNDYDERPEIQKQVGRTYYEVTFFPQDPSSFGYKILSDAGIWSDGTPMRVGFGNGYGRQFFFHSYEELKDRADLKVPYEKPEPIIIDWQVQN